MTVRQSRLVACRVAVDERGDRGAGLGHGQRDALPGEGVDVAAGVADEQHPSGDPAPGPLPQRPGAQHLAHRRGVRDSRACSAGNRARCSSNEPRVVVSSATPTSSGPPASRRPRPRGPSAPRRTTSTARPGSGGAARNRRRGATAARGRAGGGRRSAGRRRRRRSRNRSPSTTTHSAVLPEVVRRTAARRRTPAVDGGVAHRRVQRRPAHPATGRRPERCLRGTPARDVADAEQVLPRRLDAEVGERGDRTRHQPLAAGLVDRARALVPDRHVETGPGGVERGRQAGRTAADDEEVLHGDTCEVADSPGSSSRAASAWFSTRSRTVSSTALQHGEDEGGDPGRVARAAGRTPRRPRRRSWGG